MCWVKWEVALELGQSMLCISENQQFPAHTISADLQRDEGHALCSRNDCGECFRQAQEPLLEQGAASRMIAIPIGDGDGLRGILPLLKSSDAPLSVEKARIIETVGNHISNALIQNMRRAEEKHRLAVMEERSVIARERPHDSIAQSLSYLKDPGYPAGTEAWTRGWTLARLLNVGVGPGRSVTANCVS